MSITVSSRVKASTKVVLTAKYKPQKAKEKAITSKGVTYVGNEHQHNGIQVVSRDMYNISKFAVTDLFIRIHMANDVNNRCL